MRNLTDSIWQLHRLTGANVVECKAALTAADARLPDAARALMRRRMGLYERSRGKRLNFGIVRIVMRGNSASMVHLACNRATTTKQPLFYDCATRTAETALDWGDHTENIMAASINDFQTLEAVFDSNIATLGDEQTISAIKVMRGESGTIAGYAHGDNRNGFGRIGALVQLRTRRSAQANKIAQTVAMHLVARSLDAPSPPETRHAWARTSDIEKVVSERLAWDERTKIFDLLSSIDGALRAKEVLRDFACFRVPGPGDPQGDTEKTRPENR